MSAETSKKRTAGIRRVLLACIFFGSAIFKLHELIFPGIDQGALVPPVVRFFTSPGMLAAASFVEVVVAILLISNRWVNGLVGTTLLCTVFLGYVLFLIANEVDPMACGCFGRIEMSYNAHIALIFGMLLLSYSCALTHGRESPSRSKAP